MAKMKADRASGEASAAPKKQTLWTRILAIQAEAAPVYKDTDANVGDGGTKPVASIESVLNTYLPLCEKHGVTVVPVRSEVIYHGFAARTFGKTGRQYTKTVLDLLVNLVYKAVDAETGESHEFSVISHGQDSQDKATGKLLTYGLKYAYKQLFSSRSSEDDPDSARSDDDDQPRGNGKPEPQRHEDDQEEPADDPKDRKREEQRNWYAAIVKALKKEFDAKEVAESGSVPSWLKTYLPRVQALIDENKKLSAETKKHIMDFAKFHWYSLDILGNPDIEKVEKSLEKAKSANAFNSDNANILDAMLAKRKQAAEENREPGDDDPDDDGK